MVDKPLVSIIIPIYKTEKYLRACLSSVQRQTMRLFEAILVNDCTPDGAMEIAREFVNSDPRFRIIEHEVNKGLGDARNTGVVNARGEFINFLDSDDIMPADAIENLLRVAINNNADHVIGNIYWRKNHILRPLVYMYQRINVLLNMRLANVRNVLPSYYITGNVCNRLFTKSLLDNFQLSFPKGVYWEDIPFSLKAWAFSNVISVTPHIVNFRTLRDDPTNPSITQTFNRKAFLDRNKIVDEIFQFATDQSANIPDVAALSVDTLRRVLKTTNDMIDSADEDIADWIKSSWYPAFCKEVENKISLISS